MKDYKDKRFYSLNQFLREKFGDKVYKISLDGGFSCPNRDGKISSKGCIYCSSRGSGDFAGNRQKSITDQFEEIKEIMEQKWKSNKFIAYFQAYTNTYAPVEVLREKYYEAISQQGVVALSIATRPDCLGDDVLDLIEEISKKIYTFVELGLQTVNEDTAKIINRGYPLNTFEEAMDKLNKRNIDVVTHVIFGLPGENKEDMLSTIRYLNDTKIKGIKIHLLHLLKNTPMVSLYENGELEFLGKEEYIDIVTESLTLLRDDIVIHRLTGDAPRDLLIGPMWSLKKWEILNAINKEMKEKDLYQSLYYHTNKI
ncbi:MAG: TIGR01212 family radical SAM protein [Clostridiaceae bacterium]